MPPLFFFDAAAQAQWEQERPARPTFPAHWRAHVAQTDPAAAAAWDALPDQIDDALSLFAESVDVRHAARAVPGLTRVAAALAPDHRGSQQVADLLAVPDDEIIVAIYPEARAGMRARVRGIAEVGRLEGLLAEAFGVAPVGGLSGRSHMIFRDDEAGRTDDFEARFRLLRPTALGPDGSVPTGLRGVGHWLWANDRLADIPAEDGERIVLLGEPAFASTREPSAGPPLLVGELTVLEVMTETAVVRWLEGRTGNVIAGHTIRAAA